ncbi:hypothetical protein FIBSPDRAFT_868621 [Athelia psychrophila]|uniref:Uncharacterized protein n=1 Tax=Athelia psychrophila TaxID=1759441 RepID=A0A166CV04_9AGAM|nr:hypothetical protein FIBSPDRAFT_868621 [Fibularhizoctonia sp. CBS 109695]
MCTLEDAEVQYNTVEDDPCDIKYTSAEVLLAYLDGRSREYVWRNGVQFEQIS